MTQPSRCLDCDAVKKQFVRQALFSQVLSRWLVLGALGMGFCFNALFSSKPSLLAGEPTGALAKFAKSRSWSDDTGKYKIEGQLKFATAEEIQLTQSSGKSVKIPFAKLSKADQAFVNTFLKEEEKLKANDEDSDNPFKVVGKADKMPTAGSTDGEASSVATIDFAKRQPIIKGAKQIYAKMDKPFWSATPPLGFPEVQFEDMVVKTELSKPFFASMRVLGGGKAGINILSAYQQGRSESENYGRFAVVRAADSYASEVLELKEAWKLMAISADGMRAAVVRDEGWGKGNDVGILRVTKTGLVPDFQFTAGGGAWDELHYVGFAAGNRLVTISQKHSLIVWDLSNEKGPKAILQGNSGGSLHAVLSPAGELMALPAGNSIAVIDITNAKVVGLIARDNKASQISFSQDGRMLAAFEPFEIALYNMADGKELRTVAVTEHQESAQINWLGKYLMVGSVVYDVDRGLPMWTYGGNPSSRTTVGSYLVCGFGGENSSSLTLQRIPHEAALAAAENVDPEKIYAIKPQDPVSVEYRFNTTPADAQAAIRSVVEAKIEKLGWTLANNSANAILVEMEEGPQGTEDYYTRKGFGPFAPPPGFGPPPSGPLEQVTFIPWTHKITIVASGVQVYHAAHTRGAPDNLRTKEGESTQAAVTKHCQPSPAYFEHLPIPPHLLKPEYQGGLGKSTLDANGLK